MIKQDFILLLLNCEKYKYKAEKQKSTWLVSLPENIIYFHVIGNIELKTEYSFDFSNKILYVKTPDDYNSLPYKVIQSFSAINSEYDYKYIFKTDDDQNLTNPLFFYDLLRNVELNKPNYGGKFISIDNDCYSNYFTIHPELPRNLILRKTTYCNGRFYILSKNAVMNLMEKKEYIKKEYFEDYAIGYFLDNNIKENFLHIDNNVFKDNY